MTKILNHINTYADLTAYDNDKDKNYPNIAYIIETNEVKWEKVKPYFIVCNYNVTSTSNATKLLGSSTGITYQIIDDVKQDTVKDTYKFHTLGEHTVKYKLDGTSISDGLFGECSSLTSIFIPNSVTSIGNYAFNYCSSLESVSIPNSVTSIGSSAFNYCNNLTSVTIPNSVTSIGESVFSNCTGLTNIVWNVKNCGNFTSGSNPFAYLTINTLEFGSEVEIIPNYLCYKITGLTSVTIPNSVTSIGNYAFRECTDLTSITIGNSVTSIGISAFYYCNSLTSITINATTPPTLRNKNAFVSTNNCPIYVPSESLEAYRQATNWSSLASRLQPIPTV